MTTAFGSRLGLTTATVLVAVVSFLVAAGAARAASGETTLKLNGPAAERLRGAGVRIAPSGAADGGPKRVSLPVAGGLAGTKTTLVRQRGGITMSTRGGAKVRLTGLELVSRGGNARVEGKIGGAGATIFRVLRGGRREVDAERGTVRMSGLKLALTGAAAKTIFGRLGIERRGSLRFGSLAASARGLIAGGGSSGGGTTPTGGGSAPAAAACPAPSGGGPAAEASPPVKSMPPGASSIAAATLEWHVRESFVRYIATGEGTTPSGGATASAPVILPGTSKALSYDFGFPFANGWYSPGANLADPADDGAAVSFAGALRFSYSSHQIDLSAASPEIEIDGWRSRAIFNVSDNGAAPSRQVLVNLDLSRAGSITNSANSHSYRQVPAEIPAGTSSSTFGNFYAPGEEFGCFNLSFTTGP